MGIEKCRKCHEDIYQTYIKTGMGMSWGLANRSKSSSVFTPGKPLYDAKSDFYYQPYWMGDQMMVKEYRLENRDTVFSRIEKVDYIVGSGQHTNSHLKIINGYLYKVPFTYYTQIGLLDFPPGFEGGNNARFSRKIGFECISCHNSYPIPVETSINKYQSIPLGINCERCHGPGELHVKAMEEGKIVDTKKYSDFTIIRPNRLPKKLQNELCSRCHSQGNSVLVKDKTFFDFRPGMYLSDILYVFREKYDNEEDAFWMETHPERLSRSKCHSEGYEPLSCLTCHFTTTMMHQSFKNTPADTFNAKCLKCHNETNQLFCTENSVNRQSQQNNCIKCHMPKTGVLDIPHVAITDHHIRINQKWKGPVKSTNQIITGDFKGIKCMNNDHPGDLILAKAFLYHFEKFKSMPALLDSALFYLDKLPVEQIAGEWITYYYLRGSWKQLTEIAEKYDIISYADAVVVYEAGQAFHHTNLPETALKYFARAVALQPHNLEYRNKLGTEYLVLGDNDKALIEFKFILAEDPSVSLAYNNIGFISLLDKDYKNADVNFRKALAYDPDNINAHLNLAKLMMAAGSINEAIIYLSKLKKKFPEDKQVQKLLEISGQMSIN